MFCYLRMVLNVKKATKNWFDIAQDDFRVAGLLHSNKKEYLHCLFFCQQAIEKVIKQASFPS
ncbi:MAG: HEPN domain protein [Pelotomaculum sp. PtaB.Bin104]|nr:MAG: HEPN domain protein [Pelotomaculum sp. PtaB.Bin104]